MGSLSQKKRKQSYASPIIIHNLYMVIMNFVNKMEEKNVPSE